MSEKDMTVSAEWLNDHKLRSTKTGWTDGPVWRTPKMLRQESERAEKAA